jgi:tetratricopeptide (TPR) repeat protein
MTTPPTHAAPADPGKGRWLEPRGPCCGVGRPEASPARRRSVAALLVTVLAVPTPVAAQPAPNASPSPVDAAVARAAAYVGAPVCAPCHEKEHRAWLGSNHERAMQPATTRTVLGDFNGTTFSDAGISARFARKGDKFVVRTAGADGKPSDFEVAYTFGVEPLQQYLVAFPGGRLQSLTIAWDTRPKAQGGQRWFNLYPNEKITARDPLHWTGADQNWNYMCAACHSTNLQKGYDAGTDSYATTWTDVAVACEACHGPGSRHVEWARSRVSGAATPDGEGNGLLVHFPVAQLARWVIDPATGNARPGAAAAQRIEIDTCAPCHMRRSVIAAEYRTGQPLLDAYLPALLTEGLYFADGGIQGEVYEYGSFVQSKMYRSGVTCRNCHEPHGMALRAPGNGVCAQCHLPSKYDGPAHAFHAAGSKGATCVGCHMPTTTYMIVDPRHDHGLRVPRPDLSVTLGTPNACNKCHAERDARWARDQVRAWYGHDARGYQDFAAALHAGRSDAATASGELTGLVHDGAQPAIARATAFTLLPAHLDAAASGVVQAGVRDVEPIVRWAAVGAAAALAPRDRLPLVVPLLSDPTRAVRIAAAQALLDVPPGLAGAEVTAQAARGVAEFIDAQAVEADRPEAHTNLCTLLGRIGQVAEAEAECRKAIRQRPLYTPAYVNLADLYRAQERPADSERVLREGLAVAAGDAALHHALGLALVREKRLEQALDELQQAARLRPDSVRYAYVLGVGLNSAGKTERALEVLRAAHQRHPADRDVLVALTTISRDAGQLREAREYARLLSALEPSEPSVRQLREQLEALPADRTAPPPPSPGMP